MRRASSGHVYTAAVVMSLGVWVGRGAHGRMRVVVLSPDKDSRSRGSAQTSTALS